MNYKYTNEKNIQILIALLKTHKIKKIIASPGATNVSLVASLQSDSYFEVYSVVDERSAAYMACGMAEESGEPVVLTCTGATASRNYIPGLTEAYYRKLPILAITATQQIGRVGQNIAQVIDRSVIQNDIANLSIILPICQSEEDEWAAKVHINRAILELTRTGGGPVHINMETTYSDDFSVDTLPEVNPIYRIENGDVFPKIPEGRIAIFVGAHSRWNDKLTSAVDLFCGQYNAIVLCDQTSNYRGKYRVLFNLVTNQESYCAKCNCIDLLIYIGNISGAYPWFNSKEEWRVNPDGEIRDLFGNLRYVFQMNEEVFFGNYITTLEPKVSDSYFREWQFEYNRLYSLIPELPFSNIWLASKIAPLLPNNSIVHLGILNTLRSWNFFETPSEILLYANTGGFGIDGVMSAAIGAALCNIDKIVYCIIGDLAFFYDMNSLGNRYIGNNIRILLVNNGKGTEFRNYNHRCALFGDDADMFMAAAGHYGNKSDNIVKNYAIGLGFEYYSICSKEETNGVISYFIDSKPHEKPLLIEAFIDSQDESKALYSVLNIIVDTKEYKNQSKSNSSKVKNVRGLIKKAVGEKGVDIYRRFKKK